MITKTIKSGFSGCGRNSFSKLDYTDSVMISSKQERKLRELINLNIQDEEERENRLCEIENLTSIEAEDIIFQYLSATWL